MKRNKQKLGLINEFHAWKSIDFLLILDLLHLLMCASAFWSFESPNPYLNSQRFSSEYPPWSYIGWNKLGFSPAAISLGCGVHHGLVMDLSELRLCIVLHAHSSWHWRVMFFNVFLLYTLLSPQLLFISFSLEYLMRNTSYLHIKHRKATTRTSR